MNAASEAYSNALLITMSISYSRYFSTATPIATNRQSSAKLLSAFAAAEFDVKVGTNVTSTSTAATANHFSCCRSSPADRTNRTTAAATLTSNPASIKRAAHTSSGLPSCAVLNGSDQNRVAFTSSAAAASVNAPPTNHAAGRHRGERSLPSGKSTNTNASGPTATAKNHEASQANARPARTDPCAATRAWRA